MDERLPLGTAAKFDFDRGAGHRGSGSAEEGRRHKAAACLPEARMAMESLSFHLVKTPEKN